MPLDTAFSGGLSTTVARGPSSVAGATLSIAGGTLRRSAEAASPTGGALAFAGPVRLDFVHPLTKEVTEVAGPEGSTIAELLAVAGIDHRRWGGGAGWIEDAARRRDPAPVARDLFDRVRPKAGTITTVMLWPGRGGGSGGGKNILRIVLMLAVAAAAFFAAPLLAGALLPAGVSAGTFSAVTGLIGGVINIVGGLIINALVPPAQPRTAEERVAGLAEDRSGFFLQGSANRARPYAPVPVHLGRLRRYADLGAEWYTEVVGNDQYLRGFLVWGWGRLRITEIKIGETPIADFEGVEIRTVEGTAGDGPPQIYTNDAHTEGLSIELTKAAGWQTRETIDGTEEIQVEIAFPEGLGQFVTSGALVSYTVEFDAEIAPSGTESWAAVTWANAGEPGFGTAGKIVCTDASRTGQPRRVGRIKPATAGKYRVRLRRVTDPDLGQGLMERGYWAALKSIKHVLPIRADLAGKLAYTELRIKATGQLNGTIQELNAIVESYVKPFDASGFTGGAEIVSRNPAELFALVATHWTALKPIAVGRLNWANLVEWRDACAAPAQDGAAKWMYDRVLETESTLAARLDEIASAGRARRGMPGGKHGVVRDLAQTVPKQHFTPRNSWGYRIDIPFRRRLHGVRVRYNKDGLGQEHEITVYDDGYSADGSVPGTVGATELETAEAIGYTRESQVWRDWRYWLAVQRLRPHGHELMADVEHLAIGGGRGALIRVTHDVPGFGTGYGRIKSAAANGSGQFTSVTLDSPVAMAAGKTYGVRFRNHKGSFYTAVDTQPGAQTVLAFPTPQPAAWALAEGDIFGFGESNRESAELIVNGIAPAADLAAKLMLFDAAPAVHTADTGPIPAFDPQITRPPAEARDPNPPVIRSLKSDESVLIARVGGALVVRFLAEFDPPAGQPMPDFVQARWRRSAASPWTMGSAQPAAGLSYSGEGVEQGVLYRIEFRYATAEGRASDWVGRDHTIVGKTTPPPNVASLHDEGEHIRWAYPAAPLDVTHGGGFRFRYHHGDVIALGESAWLSAIPAHDDLIAGTNFAKALLPPGELTLMAKAVDADGNESAAAAMLFTEIVGPALANVLFAVDFAAAGWPGLVTGGSVQAGDLVADSASIFYPPAGVSLWANPAPVYGDQFDQLEYRFEVPIEADDAPCRVTLAPAIEGLNQHIDYWAPERGTVFYGTAPLYGADPFYGPGAWRAWPGAIDFTDAASLVARIQAGGGSSLGAIRDLVATIDVEDESELLLDVAIAAGGTALPVTKSYRRFVHVADLALLDDGGAARGVRIKSALPSATPPVIECLDAAGASTAGRVNARPQGQKA